MFLDQQNARHNMGTQMSRYPQGGMNTPAITAQTSGKHVSKRRSRWRLLLLPLIGALIIAIVLIAANLQSVSTELTVQVTNQPDSQIDLNQSLAISPYLLGSNVFPEDGTNSKDQAGQGFMSYDPQVIQGLRSAGIKLLRFPGGSWDEQHIPSTEQLNDFSNLLNQVGAEGFMQVQLSDPLESPPVSLATRATRAALLVDYMNNSQSIQRTISNGKAPYHSIKYWSIGNEPDLLINPDTNQIYTVAEYTQAFIAYSLAMHEKDPGIKIFGPEISQYTSAGGPKDRTGVPWMAGFLKGISSYASTHSLPFHLLDGVSFHIYPFGDGEVSTNTLLSNPQSWDTLVPDLRQTIRQLFDEDLPIAVTEINTNAEQGGPAPNLAALWWAETLGKLMSNQVEYVAFFSTEGVDSPYPLFLQKGLTQTAMLRTMQLFAQLQTNLVPIQNQSAQDPVSIYATQASGHNTVSLLFLNQTATSQQISVKTEGVLPFHTWQGANMTLPGYGMVVLTLQHGGSDEAFLFNNQTNAQQEAPEVQRVVCGNQTGSAFAC